MQSRIHVILTIFSIVWIFGGCKNTNNPVVSNELAATGKVSFSLNKEAAPPVVSTVVATMTREDSLPLRLLSI